MMMMMSTTLFAMMMMWTNSPRWSFFLQVDYDVDYVDDDNDEDVDDNDDEDVDDGNVCQLAPEARAGEFFL